MTTPRKFRSKIEQQDVDGLNAALLPAAKPLSGNSRSRISSHHISRACCHLVDGCSMDQGAPVRSDLATAPQEQSQTLRKTGTAGRRLHHLSLWAVALCEHGTKMVAVCFSYQNQTVSKHNFSFVGGTANNMCVLYALHVWPIKTTSLHCWTRQACVLHAVGKHIFVVC